MYVEYDLALDITDRTARFNGILTVPANASSSLTVSKATNEFIFAFMLTSNATTYGSCFVNQSTGVVTYGLSGPGDALLYYGVF
jgi:hypothetical protein